MSAALCFVCLLLFSVTGIVLHHPKVFLAKPAVTITEGDVPQELLPLMTASGEKKNLPVPQPVYDWFSAKNIFLNSTRSEIKEGNFFIPFGRPGVSASVNINLSSGHYKYELSDRGWLGYLGDLHKGKNTGDAWVYFVDIFAIACIIFSITGFVLLQRYANTRAKTWPLLIAGFLLPVFFMLFLIH